MASAPTHKRILEVLDRQAPCDALPALISAMRGSPSDEGIQPTALGIDSSVFLRLSGHKKAADLIDYLTSGHSAPLIVPGQAIQEFWNNQLQVVETVSSSLRKHFEGVRAGVENMGEDFGPVAGEATALLDKAQSEYGYLYDEGTLRKTLSLLESLQRSAIVPFAPRQFFMRAAEHRKATKTPPGFKDDGHGDFYVWVDLLVGLALARKRRIAFTSVAIVTRDQKPDWSRSNVAHPLLSAEMHTLYGVPLKVWTLEDLARKIAAVI